MIIITTIATQDWQQHYEEQLQRPLSFLCSKRLTTSRAGWVQEDVMSFPIQIKWELSEVPVLKGGALHSSFLQQLLECCKSCTVLFHSQDLPLRLREHIKITRLYDLLTCFCYWFLNYIIHVGCLSFEGNNLAEVDLILNQP